MKYLILFFLIIGCGGEKRKPQAEVVPVKKLEAKRKRYIEMVSVHQDEYGFIHTDKCDATLFSGLFGTALDVDLTQARNDDGQWFRRPGKDCYPDNSASTISRDMLLGVYWWAWHNRKLDVATDLLNYARKNNNVMGQGEISRTLLTPGMKGTLAELVFRLGGENAKVVRQTPQAWDLNIGNGLKGYQAHLQILHILLGGDLRGEVSEGAIEIIKEHYERVPQNPLFSYAYELYFAENLNGTIELLLDDKYFPNDRLPNSKDRCTEWLFQRDPKDWEPCDDDVVEYPGGEFIFLASLIGGKHGRSNE